MSAPDRPTRGEVDACMGVADDGLDPVARTLAAEVRALRAELEQQQRFTEVWRRGHAETTEGCKAEIRRLRAALAARTPQPDEHVGVEAAGVLWMALRYAMGRRTYAVQEVGDAIAQHAHRLAPWQRERMAQEIERELGYDADAAAWGSDTTTLQRAISDLRATLPTVPDGEGDPDVLHDDDVRGARPITETGTRYVCTPADGEDALTVHAGALALALHDADCRCGDYDEVEDPRYITAVRAVLDNRDVTPRGTITAAESAVGNLLFNSGETDPGRLARLIVSEIRTVLPTPVAWAPSSDGEDVPARLDAAAEVVAKLGFPDWAEDLRGVADEYRYAPDGVRAAVAAALAARPTEREK